MTTYVQARDTLVASINAGFSVDHPDLKLFYENTVKVDMNSVGDAFAVVSIDMITARQATVEFNPSHRVVGQVTVRLMLKEGKGSRQALTLFDYVADLLAFKLMGGVTTRAPSPGKKQISDGWVAFDIHVPFTFDSTT